MPRTWAFFLGGGVDEQNAVTAAMLAASLPDDAASAWSEFDEKVVGIAGILTPARFRVSARAARERVHPESLEARHTRAAEDRDVWATPELDGMATLTACLPRSPHMRRWPTSTRGPATSHDRMTNPARSHSCARTSSSIC